MPKISKTALQKILSTAELSLGCLLTILIISIHLLLLLNIGSLWRDEVQIFNIATAPSFAELWNLNEHDTFPIFWQMVLRGWTAAGPGTSDFGLRCLGFLVGIGILAMVWWNARQTSMSVPLITLALFCLNPTIIRFGDSIRGYGFGALWMLCMIGAISRMVRQPTKRHIIIAGIAAVLAVQSFYFSAVLLLACGCGAFAVSLRNRSLKPILPLLGIGCIAAVSLLPYVDPLLRQAEWNNVIKSSVNGSWFFERFTQATDKAGADMIWVWITLVCISLAVSLYCSRRNTSDLQPGQCDEALFYGVSMVSGIIAYTLFLFASHLMTSSWYYIGILGFLGMTIDACVHLFVNKRRFWRMIRLCGCLALILYTVGHAVLDAKKQMTNIDRIAVRLENLAENNDLIIICPWWMGVTFTRYYHGKTPWTTLPAMWPLTIQRFDSLRSKLVQANPVDSVFSRMCRTLQSGNRVWVAGNLQPQKTVEWPGDLPPAIQLLSKKTPQGGLPIRYMKQWSEQAACILQTRSTNWSIDTVSQNRRVFPEYAWLIVFEGWQ